MSHNLALLIALALPVVAFTLFRINAALVFLSLCLGTVLVQYVAGEANSLISLFSEQAGSMSVSTLQLTLLFAPAAVTCVVTIFSVHGKLKSLYNMLPAIATSAFAILLVIPLLPFGLRYALEEQTVWRIMTQGQAFIVGVGALVSLAFLWTQRKGFKHHDRRSKG